MRKPPKLKEIAPGEMRTVCWVCETPVGSRSLFCAEHKDRKKKLCEGCGKGTRGKLCAECLQRKREEETVAPASGQLRNGKRVLTEADKQVVEKWWAEGVKGTEIAKKLGLATSSPTGAIIGRRRKGWKLAYRNEAAIEHGRQIAEKRNRERVSRI